MPILVCLNHFFSTFLHIWQSPPPATLGPSWSVRSQHGDPSPPRCGGARAAHRNIHVSGAKGGVGGPGQGDRGKRQLVGRTW